MATQEGSGSERDWGPPSNSCSSTTKGGNYEMKINKDVHMNVIVDALDIKFSKDESLNQKIARLIKKRKNKEVIPAEVFAFSAEDTLLLIKRNHSQKIRHLLFLDSHTREPFHIENIHKYKVE